MRLKLSLRLINKWFAVDGVRIWAAVLQDWISRRPCIYRLANIQRFLHCDRVGGKNADPAAEKQLVSLA